MNPLIELKNITYKAHNRTILDIPEFQIQTGEFLGIMGPNGAGKSTLLKVLAFLEQQNSGEILYRGQAIPKGNAPLELRRKFSIALQQSLLLDGTVFHNIAIGLTLRKVSKSVIKEKVGHWMELFGISHLAKKNALYLSGGEAQRVNLARAMIVEPEILFLDEPFSALDFPTKIRLMEDFKQIIEDAKTTAVFVSHDLMEVNYLTKQLAIIVNGEVKQVGLTPRVLEHPNSSTASFLNEWKKFYPVAR
ncbi:ATP-binding cassette domain-containing protein [Bacillus sp. ISL-40]|uniref:ABC transporter ATP-binding protein n=1 Tax=unclassified Bacillus (in: firmicutes) TaxID=185979 RepID=UPI001BEAAD0F|nr:MULTISPECIES: ATP-binding cassette domain-containing protein [unclassified Bacillus (in: firmicutes)]MBT2698086.1 ATP-binding cassette domain-containing protein [Bacillus sp. ISL-40]MBT2742092.1 ATP-binding cassette domain-containing protein [Bacillus sp. ISL-77]